MTIFAIVIAFAASALLLVGGYLIGVRRGNQAREKLREIVRRQQRAVQLAREEISRRANAQEDGLRAMIEQALGPLVSREQLSIALSSLKAGEGARDLTLLLDGIAEAGNFSAVALSDSDGLPLAGNSAAQDVDRLAAYTSFILLMTDRIGSSGFPAPTSVLVRDVADRTTLCRIFEVQGRRMLLTAVAEGAHLTPATLDPAMAKVSGVLART